MAKARIMETVISIAGEISPTLGKTIASVNKQLGGINDVAIVAGAAITAIGKSAIDATKYLNELGTEYQKAVNGVSASTGLAGKELEAMKDSIKDVYGSNFGESVGDVAEGISEVYRNTKLLGKELTETTKGAYALSDTFGYDISESSRAAKALMSNFGVSGEEAMGLIAAGAQNGLDFSGELLDSISEYSVQFAKVGFSADDMFQIFQTGADNGAWNLDKVGDAVKEFSIRSIDGSKGTKNAFKSLGLNADKMMATFANGGEGAEKAFQVVINKLVGMKDEVDRDAVGVALFGTMWEDLGVDAMKAMAKAEKGVYNTKDALGQINEVKYNDLDSAMEGIKRKCEVALMPAAESVSKAFLDQVPKLEKVIEQIAPIIADFAEKIGPAITKAFDGMEKGLKWMVENEDTVVPAISGIAAAFAAFKIGNFVKDAGGVPGVLAKMKGALVNFGKGFSFLTSPIFWVAIAIGALVGGIVWLYKNWDIAKEKILKAGEKIGEVWEKVSGWVSDGIGKLSEKFPIIGEYFSGVWESIKKAAGHIKNVFHGIVDFIDNVFSGNWRDAWENVKDIFKNSFGAIAELAFAPLRGVIGMVQKAYEKVTEIVPKIGEKFPVLGAFATEAWSSIQNGVEHFKKALESIPEFFKNIFEGKWQAAWDSLKNIVWDWYNGILNIALSLFRGLWSMITAGFGKLKEFLSQTWGSIKQGTANAWESVKTTISNKWTAIKNYFYNVLLNIKNQITGTWEGVKTYLSNAWTTIKNTAMEKWNSIKTGISNVWTDIKNGVAGFIDSVKQAVADGFSGLKDTMLAPFQDAAAKIDEVKGKISGVVDKVKNFSLSDTLASWGVPGFATGGFTTGPSIAGEAGTEAVISFDPRYRSDNLAYWAKAGRMLGADMSDFGLAGSSTSNYVDLGGVTFAPNITVQGDAKKQDIVEAIRAAYPEFLDMLEELLADREVAVYG